MVSSQAGIEHRMTSLTSPASSSIDFSTRNKVYSVAGVKSQVVMRRNISRSNGNKTGGGVDSLEVVDEAEEDREVEEKVQSEDDGLEEEEDKDGDEEKSRKRPKKRNRDQAKQEQNVTQARKSPFISCHDSSLSPSSSPSLSLSHPLPSSSDGKVHGIQEQSEIEGEEEVEKMQTNGQRMTSSGTYKMFQSRMKPTSCSSFPRIPSPCLPLDSTLSSYPTSVSTALASISTLSCTTTSRTTTPSTVLCMEPEEDVDQEKEIDQEKEKSKGDEVEPDSLSLLVQNREREEEKKRIKWIRMTTSPSSSSQHQIPSPTPSFPRTPSPFYSYVGRGSSSQSGQKTSSMMMMKMTKTTDRKRKKIMPFSLSRALSKSLESICPEDVSGFGFGSSHVSSYRDSAGGGGGGSSIRLRSTRTSTRLRTTSVKRRAWATSHSSSTSSTYDSRKMSTSMEDLRVLREEGDLMYCFDDHHDILVDTLEGDEDIMEAGITQSIFASETESVAGATSSVGGALSSRTPSPFPSSLPGTTASSAAGVLSSLIRRRRRHGGLMISYPHHSHHHPHLQHHSRITHLPSSSSCLIDSPSKLRLISKEEILFHWRESERELLNALQSLLREKRSLEDRLLLLQRVLLKPP